MSNKLNLSIETQLVQSLEPFSEGEARVQPIVNSTTFNYTSPETLAKFICIERIRIFLFKNWKSDCGSS